MFSTLALVFFAATGLSILWWTAFYKHEKFSAMMKWVTLMTSSATIIFAILALIFERS